MRKGLVSVVIPCLNAAPWIAGAIKSCLDQSWDDIEVLLVDNGSTDGSVDVARSFTDRRIQFAHCERRGAGAARNTGLALARGEFVQFLDADDLLHPQKIRIQMERLAQLPEGRIASGAWTTFRDDPAEAVFAPQPVWRDLARGEFLISSWQGGGMMPVFAWLTPRAVIDKAGPWNESLSLEDDGEYFTRVNLACTAVAFCRESQGYYRKYPRPTLSSRSDPAALGSAFEAARLSIDALLAADEFPEARSACADRLQRVVHFAYPDVPRLVRLAESRIEELGGSRLEYPGGRSFRILAACAGWKFAKRCQLAWRRQIGASAMTVRRKAK